MIYLLLGIISSASISLVFKFFGDQQGNRYGIIIGNYLTCILISLIMTGGIGPVVSAVGITYGLGAIGGMFSLYCTIKGISNVVKGKREPLPLIGGIQLFK